MAKQKQSEEQQDDQNVDMGTGFEEGEGLVVDLGDADENAGFEAIPRGVYDCVVDSVEFSYSQRSGNPMWTWMLEVENGEYAGRKLFYHTTFTEGGIGRVKKALKVIGSELAESKFNPQEVADSGELAGSRLRARVDVRPYEGEMRNNVRALMAASEGGDDFLPNQE